MPTIGNAPHQVRQTSGEPTDRIEWDGTGLYGGEVAAIIIGAVVGCSILMVTVLWFFKRRFNRQMRQQQKEKQMSIENGDNPIMEETPTTGGLGTTQTRDSNYNHVNTGGVSGPTATRDYAAGNDGVVTGWQQGVGSDGTARV
ncbi:hypothetical protein F5X68DRAFT_192270 [Plectosphaerella plurivora]|uniref:Uncharacterized protein n=1 Tax=Plectosphaerella plurivora TaxID=936078 RepID=A0A9P9A8H1_9PEZI|nr:hypothetical protein F5X68DRAFT_192270 [Plectosphaerella plurivora]